MEIPDINSTVTCEDRRLTRWIVKRLGLNYPDVAYRDLDDVLIYMPFGAITFPHGSLTLDQAVIMLNELGWKCNITEWRWDMECIQSEDVIIKQALHTI